MEGIPDYHDADAHSRNTHALEVGDEIDAGFGPAVEVVEIDDVGVKFSDGTTATHNTVCRNMVQLGLLDE